jgi:methylenetetrahydrofolate dehydrogenase (NADP+)/methenyltetrahydrofolate cyclohydrolase
MTAAVIDGKAFAAGLRGRIAQAVAGLGFTPGLAVVLVGDDPASQVYVRNKGEQTRAAGMNSFEFRLPATASEAELLARVAALNADPAVHGILVQLPLPKHMDSAKVIDLIDPDKDVDGFHVVNAGRLAVGAAGTVPCTPLGCLMLIKDRLGDNLAGLDALVIGRSNIVGKPMAQLLLRESCTVTIAHSKTRDLASLARKADILVAAVGVAQMVKGDWVKPGALVIDVGMNRVPKPDGSGTRLVGDVDYPAAAQVAGHITPVPGGVGPMTIACLLANTLTAACAQAGVPVPKL